MSKERHILPTQTINKVLAYLSGKAYSEVALIINEVKSLAAPYVDPAPVDEPNQDQEVPVAQEQEEQKT